MQQFDALQLGQICDVRAAAHIRVDAVDGDDTNVAHMIVGKATGRSWNLPEESSSMFHSSALAMFVCIIYLHWGVFQSSFRDHINANWRCSGNGFVAYCLDLIDYVLRQLCSEIQFNVRNIDTQRPRLGGELVFLLKNGTYQMLTYSEERQNRRLNRMNSTHPLVFYITYPNAVAYDHDDGPNSLFLPPFRREQTAVHRWPQNEWHPFLCASHQPPLCHSVCRDRMAAYF